MLPALDLSILIIIMISGISGTIICSSVFIVYFRHWKEISNPGVCDNIQFVTVITNTLFQSILIINAGFEFFHIYLMLDKHLLFFMVMIECVLIDVSFWNTTWISIFYSITLVKVSQFFLCVKTKFMSFVPQLIMGSLLCSIVLNIPVLWTLSLDFRKNITGKTIVPGYIIKWNPVYSVCNTVFGYSIPLSMTCLCIGLSVTTVLRHIWRMKQGESHVTSPQLQALVRAIGTMTLRVTLDIAFFVITTSTVMSPYSGNNNVLLFIFWLFMQLYPTIQTLIIILGNPRFKSILCGHRITT